jgi:hypothetical protein
MVFVLKISGSGIVININEGPEFKSLQKENIAEIKFY